jgi:DNA-binding FadR family transcriptional regulator
VWARKVTLNAYRRIYGAIAEGDAELAQKSTQRHDDDYLHFLDEYYPNPLDQIVRWSRLA